MKDERVSITARYHPGKGESDHAGLGHGSCLDVMGRESDEYACQKRGEGERELHIVRRIIKRNPGQPVNEKK
jgi:hypothetical protein